MKINKIFISHKFYQKKYDKDRAICYYLFQNYTEATYHKCSIEYLFCKNTEKIVEKY